jgi:PAS domain S-box-containing protein
MRRAGIDAALEETESRYRALFEQSPIGVFTFDRSLRLRDCNFAFVRLLDSAYDRLIGLDLRALRDASLGPFFERVLQGEPVQYEGPYVATTSERAIEISLRLSPLRDGEEEVTGGIGLVEDITARKAAEQALARSEANFRALIETAPDAIGVFRSNGEHLYVNPKLAQYLGYPREEMKRMRVPELVHEGDRPMFHERTRRRERGEVLPPAEYRLLHKDGRVVSAEIISMPVQFDGGPAVLSMIRDLTERKQIQLKLLQSDRLASVGMLAAGIAHEINNPLAYVMANLDVLSRKLLPDVLLSAPDDDARQRVARVAEHVEHARDGAERVRRIVRDVRTFARGDDDAREPLDVQAVIDAALQLVAHELRDRARLVRDFAPVPRVSASESRLGQVFLNLLVNALQALPLDRGKEHEVRVSISAPDPQTVLVEIHDTGEGIPADVLPRVFDPFFTTKPVGVGTGLGLFVCQGIVSSVGGTLALASEPGRGTTVSVRLPALVETSAASSAPPSSLGTAPRRSRVLLVDDEVSLGRALAAALQGEHDVVTVDGGEAALALLAKDAAFDVILCDLMMPDVSGIETYTRAVAARPALAERFVFITGGAFSAEATAFLGDRRACLEKPFDMAQLRELLRRRAPRR